MCVNVQRLVYFVNLDIYTQAHFQDMSVTPMEDFPISLCNAMLRDFPDACKLFLGSRGAPLRLSSTDRSASQMLIRFFAFVHA